MPKKRIFVDNPDPAGPEIDPETNTIDVGGGMFGSRENIPPPPYGQDKGDNRRYQHPSLQASHGGTFNPSMSQFSSEWFPQGQRATSHPLFTEEGSEHYQAAYEHNKEFAAPGSYNTQLPANEESQFRSWINNKKVPFDPNAKTSDYDMRGYYQAQQTGKAKPWQGSGSHFPDTYKTPYDTTFSSESKYAKPNTPFSWSGDRLIDKRSGQVIFDPPGRTPTADEEALQEPAIDPVVLAAGGVAGGLENVMNKPAGNMAGKIVSRGMGSLRYEMEPSLIRMAQNFGKGAWNTGKSGALVQAINNYLLPQHHEVGKAASLPIGNKLTNKADRMLEMSQRGVRGIDEPPSIVDKFGKPIFDESGKMIPWSEAEKASGKAASKINWTNVGDMLRKLVGDIGEVE